MTSLFAFMCGRHALSGTYQEQMEQYREISKIREEMEEEKAFAEIQLREEDELEPKLSRATKFWLAQMDLVWEEYGRRKKSGSL